MDTRTRRPFKTANAHEVFNLGQGHVVTSNLSESMWTNLLGEQIQKIKSIYKQSITLSKK